MLALTLYSDPLSVAVADSTEGGVIDATGGANASENTAVSGNQTTSLEIVIALAPKVIVIAQPVEFGAEKFRQNLLDNEALAEVPAIRDGTTYLVESKHFTTLFFWNIRGAEDLAHLLWPSVIPRTPRPSPSAWPTSSPIPSDGRRRDILSGAANAGGRGVPDPASSDGRPRPDRKQGSMRTPDLLSTRDRRYPHMGTDGWRRLRASRVCALHCRLTGGCPTLHTRLRG